MNGEAATLDGLPPELESIVASTAADMKALGRAVGRAMTLGDVIGLVGPLGAGKTTLAQGIAEGLSVSAERHVASPTFALVNEHPARVPFVHADFYRLSNEAELAELGLDEIFERAAVVIEWSDLFPAALPVDYLRVTIAPASHGIRTLTLLPGGHASLRLAASLTAAAAALPETGSFVAPHPPG